MGTVIHKTRPIKVWADVDEGISDFVEYLNSIEGIRTHGSCQGSIGEGGPHPYRAYAQCSWTDEAFEKLKDNYEIEPLGDHWGYIYPNKVTA